MQWLGDWKRRVLKEIIGKNALSGEMKVNKAESSLKKQNSILTVAGEGELCPRWAQKMPRFGMLSALADGSLLLFTEDFSRTTACAF